MTNPFGWSYPPGVSGNEPEITGEYPIDPHRPFSYFRTIDVDLGQPAWVVCYGEDEEDGIFSFPSEAEAKAQATAWNDAMPGCWFNKLGACVLCGEPDPELQYDEWKAQEAAEKAYNESLNKPDSHEGELHSTAPPHRASDIDTHLADGEG